MSKIKGKDGKAIGEKPISSRHFRNFLALLGRYKPEKADLDTADIRKLLVQSGIPDD